VQATNPNGSDWAAFEMQGIPTLHFSATSARPGQDGKENPSYAYSYAWHTTNDLYSELVPYAEHLAHSALVTAVVAYGVANLDEPLPRDGVYLPDGLYATLTIGSGDAARQIMTTLDYVNAPLATANFVRIAEGKTPRPGGSRGGRGGPPRGMGFGGRGGRGGPDVEVPPVGRVLDIRGGLATMQIVSEVQKSVAIPALPKTTNKALKHEIVGILGVSGPNTFYLTLQTNKGLDRKYAAIGKVIGGLSHLQYLKAGDAIQDVRITRVGQAARDFKTDDEGFGKLMETKKK
jgi:hypothetical protein